MIASWLRDLEALGARPWPTNEYAAGLRAEPSKQGRTVMWRSFAGALGAIALATAAIAQDDPWEHYRAFQAASEEGRTDDAIAALDAAWRAAETAWGDSRDTGVLAFNLAVESIRAGQVEQAFESAVRARDLEQVGLLTDDVSAADAELLVAVSELAREGRRRDTVRLVELLTARSEEPSPYSDVVVIGWIFVAKDDQSRRREMDALEHATAARRAGLRTGVQHASLLVDAAILESNAAAARRQWETARNAMGWAIYAFWFAHPENNVPATNTEMAKLYAWQSAFNTLILTNTPSRPELGTRIMPETRFGEISADDAPPGVPDSPSCYSWSADRTVPRYPAAEMQRGRFGAVLMAYDVALDGSVQNVRVAATAPENMSEGFARVITAAMATWRAEVVPGATEDCLRHQTTAFQFAFQ
jgi:hypothetical protein